MKAMSMLICVIVAGLIIFIASCGSDDPASITAGPTTTTKSDTSVPESSVSTSSTTSPVPSPSSSPVASVSPSPSPSPEVLPNGKDKHEHSDNGKHLGQNK